jgi:hypothetical protein
MAESKRGKPGDAHKPFEIFRAADRVDYVDKPVMEIVADSAAIVEGLTAFNRAGAGAGQKVTVAYSRPGLSLSHVWFKSGYPLPLHSHAGDCLYYLVAGSVRVGSEELKPGDGFFVGSDVPYTYETGPEGAEVLEFRASDAFNIRFMAKTKRAWDKAAARLQERQADWATEPPPSQRAAEGKVLAAKKPAASRKRKPAASEG